MELIKCALCDKQGQDLSKHIISIHKLQLDKYKEVFGEYCNADVRLKRGNGSRSKVKSSEHKEKIRQSNIITKSLISEENKNIWKKKLSESKKGSNAWNKGLTKETNESIANATVKMLESRSKNNVWLENLRKSCKNPERNKKISESKKGMSRPYELIEKLKAFNKGRLRNPRKFKKCSICNKEFITIDGTKEKVFCSHNCWCEGMRIISSESIKKTRKFNTKPEIIMKQMLEEINILSLFIHNESIGFCCPDFVNKDNKIAIFCDGDFWHGNKETVFKNKEYSVLVTQETIRDRIQEEKMRLEGWKYIRFWQSDLEYKYSECKDRLIDFLNQNGLNSHI